MFANFYILYCSMDLRDTFLMFYQFVHTSPHRTLINTINNNFYFVTVKVKNSGILKGTFDPFGKKFNLLTCSKAVR